MAIGRKYIESIRYGRVLLLKRKDNKFWYAKYRLNNSPKWVERSLKTRVLKDAQRHGDHLNSQLLSQTLGVADGTVPIVILFRDFFSAMKGHLADETDKRLTSSQHNLERWMEEFHPEVKLVKHLTPFIIRDFQHYRVTEHEVSPRTADNDIANLHTIFKWGEREGLVGKSPFNYSKSGSVKLYDQPEPEPDTYTDDEYRRLVEAAEKTGDLLIRDMIVVLADTGLRFGELANLTNEALHWKTTPPHIDIRARNGWKPKDPKEIKQVPMSASVIEVLKRREANAKGGLLFRNGVGNQIAENHTRDRLKSLFPDIGISPNRRLHWHSWRNHFVVRCLDAGIPVHHVMAWTGHDSVSMVMHYARVRSRDRIGAAEFSKLPPRSAIPG